MDKSAIVYKMTQLKLYTKDKGYILVMHWYAENYKL